jgi:hypothetical protein
MRFPGKPAEKPPAKRLAKPARKPAGKPGAKRTDPRPKPPPSPLSLRRPDLLEPSDSMADALRLRPSRRSPSVGALLTLLTKFAHLCTRRCWTHREPSAPISQRRESVDVGTTEGIRWKVALLYRCYCRSGPRAKQDREGHTFPRVPNRRLPTRTSSVASRTVDSHGPLRRHQHQEATNGGFDRSRRRQDRCVLRTRILLPFAPDCDRPRGASRGRPRARRRTGDFAA